MAFWTSKTPGVLPKWVFWMYVLFAVLALLLTAHENASTGGSRPALGAAINVIAAVAARQNRVKGLVILNAIVGSAITIGLILPASPVNPEQVSLIDALFAFGMAVYLYQYRNTASVSSSTSLPPPTNARDSIELCASSDSNPYKEAGSLQKNTMYRDFDLTDDERFSQDQERIQADLVMDSRFEASPADYAEELRLFEVGELDLGVWAKHLVESEGNAEKAKWSYIKDRVISATTRRALFEQKTLEEVERAKYQAEKQLNETDEVVRRKLSEADEVVRRKLSEADEVEKKAEQKLASAHRQIEQQKLEEVGRRRVARHEAFEQASVNRFTLIFSFASFIVFGCVAVVVVISGYTVTGLVIGTISLANLYVAVRAAS